MEEQIKSFKEKVDPVLAAHCSGAVLTGYDDGVAMVKLTRLMRVMSVGSVHDRRSGQGHRDGERSGC